MTKVTIFGHGFGAPEIEALQALLAETGVCAFPVEVVETISDRPPDDDDAAIVILGTLAACLNSDLEANLARAQTSTQRVIWVWPEGSTDSDLPPPAKKYCYSVVPWSADKLRAALADDDITYFETGDGVPLLKVETERNCCVEDEKVKPK